VSLEKTDRTPRVTTRGPRWIFSSHLQKLRRCEENVQEFPIIRPRDEVFDHAKAADTEAPTGSAAEESSPRKSGLHARESK
jgi:hypothetical protein